MGVNNLESEFTRKIRERQLQEPAVESCGLCSVTAPTRSAKAGINWFQRHAQTRKHQDAIRRRDAATR